MQQASRHEPQPPSNAEPRGWSRSQSHIAILICCRISNVPPLAQVCLALSLRPIRCSCCVRHGCGRVSCRADGSGREGGASNPFQSRVGRGVGWVGHQDPPSRHLDRYKSLLGQFTIQLPFAGIWVHHSAVVSRVSGHACLRIMPGCWCCPHCHAPVILPHSWQLG